MKQTTDKNFLDGHVTVETLPPKADADGRFRGGDDRGEVAMIISGSVLQYVELAEFRGPGVRRGFHYHETYVERLYVIRGAIRVSARLMSTGALEEFTVNAGNIITIRPPVAHAFLSIEDSLVLSMGSGVSPFVDRHLFKDLNFRGATDETG